MLRTTSRLLTLISLLAAPALAQDGMATYRLTFQSTWSPQTHPTQFPSNPHYSPLIGATHSPVLEIWEPGGIATSGIEQMAETGATSVLSAEINQQVQAGTASQLLSYGSAGMLGTSPGSVSVTFTVTQEFSELTMVTMLAPSPDWFVGVHGVSMMSGRDWIESMVLPANLYDAGTDSGTSYNSADADVTPHLPIRLVTTASGPFANAPVQVGTFTIERLHSTLVYGCGIPLGSMTVSGTAQLGQSVQVSLQDPTGQLPTPAASGLALSTVRDSAFPCGTTLGGFGLAAGSDGKVLLGSASSLLTGPLYNGGPNGAVFTLAIPNNPGLVGFEFFAQGMLASNRVGLTEAVAVRVGN